MFFLRDLEQTISLHPSFFGPRVRDYLTNKLFQDAEGTCNGQYYIICVVDPYDISEGRVLPGIAKAEYTIRYRAVVWKPFRGEIVSICGVCFAHYTLTATLHRSSMPPLHHSTEWDSSLTSDHFRYLSQMLCVTRRF
jgi:hypothetical protein